MKNSFVLLYIVFTFLGCQYLEKHVPSKDELLNKELNKINWSQVDEPPFVLACDTIVSKTLRKQCFFDFVTQSIQEKLTVDSIKVLYPKLDTLKLKVTVFNDAQLLFESQLSNTQNTHNPRKIDSLLRIHLSSFPPIEPAIKRGVKVKSEFIIPVVLN
jgi:hypothetical protein